MAAARMLHVPQKLCGPAEAFGWWKPGLAKGKPM